MKKPKPKTEEYWRKRCVEIAKKIARILANYKCAYCGLGEPERRTHGSHIYSEGVHKGMSAEVKNILCLCARHHATGYWNRTNDFNWHSTPAEAIDWFWKKYPELAEELRIMAQHPIRQNWELKLVELKKQLKKCLPN